MTPFRVFCQSFVVLLVVGSGMLFAQEAEKKVQPPPPYKVRIERDVRVRMRDGVQLSTDLYIPIKDGQPPKQKIPAVLMRTPYNKTPEEKASSYPLEKMAEFFASHGYLSVVQDCHGRFASEGDFFAFVNEPKDGYDTIEWIAKQPLCNGKVGMYGCSYLGWVQLQAAALRPPSLVTMIPFEGPTNGYHYSMHTGGAIHLGLLHWCLNMAANSHEAKKKPDLAAGLKQMAGEKEFMQWAARIPWQRGQTPLSAIPLYEDFAFKLFFENQDYNDFWRQTGLGMDEHFDAFPDIPTLWVVGWYDWYPRSLSDGYQKMVSGRKHQHLLIGPWVHNNFDPACGEVHFGSQGGKIRKYEDYLNLELRWFDRWLKNDKKVELGKPVSIFVMGGGDGTKVKGKLNQGGRWEFMDQWPPADCKPTPFYLHKGLALSETKPSQASAGTSYTYDPRNTVSSNTRCFVPMGPAQKKGRQAGPHDQIELDTLPGHGMPGMPVASRPDVLVFQTEPLKTDVQITGEIKMVLHVSSDAPDTDFFVRLLDVHPVNADYPRGFVFPVSDGVIRARYRNGYGKGELMKPGEVYRLEIPLEPSANVFKAGHRIRVAICSSNFPAFDINRNTGDPFDRRWRIAENTVWHGGTHASHIVLPVVPSSFSARR